jgi:hypothetical protein
MKGRQGKGGEKRKVGEVKRAGQDRESGRRGGQKRANGQGEMSMEEIMTVIGQREMKRVLKFGVKVEPLYHTSTGEEKPKNRC